MHIDTLLSSIWVGSSIDLINILYAKGHYPSFATNHVEANDTLFFTGNIEVEDEDNPLTLLETIDYLLKTNNSYIIDKSIVFSAFNELELAENLFIPIESITKI